MVAIELVLLAIKINMSSNINRYSSIEREEDTNDFKTLLEFYQYLKVSYHFLF